MATRAWHVVLVVLLLSSPVVAQLDSADQLYAAAERAYAEKSFATARDLYAKLVQAFPGDARASEAEYKAADCELKLNRPKEGLKRLEAFVATHADSLLAAKARRLVFERHSGRRKRDREADERLLTEAIAWLEAHAGEPEAHKELLWALSTYESFLAGQQTDDAEARAKLRERRRALLRRLADLAQTHEDAANAAWRLADFHAQGGEKAEALAIWQEIVTKWPETQLAPPAQSRIAGDLNQREEHAKALEAYRFLVDRWPKSQEAKYALNAIAEIVNPSLGLDLNYTQLPGQPVHYSLSTRNVRQARLALYRADAISLFFDEKTDRWHPYPETPGPSDKPLREWQTDVEEWRGHRPSTLQGEFPLDGPGTYVLIARDRDSKAQTQRSINATSLVAIQSQNPDGELLTYVVDRTTGLAAPGARVDVRLDIEHYGTGPKRERTREVVFTSGGVTNASGIARAYLPEVGERDHLDGARGLVRHEGQIALLGVPAGRSRWEDKPALVGYVYTDRPVYRPGDTVHFSAVLRRLADGKLGNLPNTTIHVAIRDPKGAELLRTELVTNEFGTLHGEYEVGTDDPPLGKYQVYVGVDGLGSSGAFRVEEYKKPEFLVTIESASTDVLPGEEAKATIRVEYYWGQPVPGAQISYSVKAANYWPTYDFPSRYGWLFGDWGSYEYARWKAYGRSAYDFRAEEPRGPVWQATAYTDERGEAVITFATYKCQGRDYAYTISADVTDESRHTVSGSASLKVTHQSFYLHPRTVQRLYHASDKVTVDLRALTPNDQPVMTAGKLMLYKLIPSEREIEEQGKKRIERYEKREAALDEPLTFLTDADGNAHVTFIPDREGWFEIEVSAEDPRRDEPTKATTRFWAVNHDFDGQNLDYTNLTLETERDIYEVGETARVLINAPVKNADALVLIRGRQRQTSQVVRLNGSATVLEVPIVEEFRPSVALLVALVDEGHVYEQKRVLFVPPSEKLLQVEVNSEKSEYRPGETGRFDVTVRDRQGHPAEAEVCLAVADEAVYYIQDEMAQPIEKAFYARDSRVRPYIVSSWERQHVTERSVSVMYAGARMESPYDPWSAGGMGRAGPAGPKGARGGYEFAMGISRLEIFNQGFAPSEQELVEPTLRKLFADTCFWGPTLRTGADGKASAEVTFPDNLTTWRATARAVTRTTQVGQSKGEARTSKDIIARLQAPRFLVAGDRCTISTLAHNYLDEAKDVQVEFAAEGVQCAATAPRQVRIEPKAEARVDREVVAETPGTALLTAKALTNVESDAMQLPVPVLPHRVERFVYRAGQVADEGGETFELPAERVPGSEALTVRITPSVAASLLDALPFLADYPYGCIEQTMNRFLPSVIVAETVKKLGLDPGGKLEDVPRKVEAGLRRIRQLREERGGWGWWPGATDAHMTAYVVSGLLRAKAAGYPQSSYILQDELKRLREGLRYGHRLDDLAFEVYVLAQAGERPGDAVDRVYAEREKLNDYSRALLALTLHYMHDSREQVVLRNLLDYRVETERGCHWGQQGGWRWSDDKVEATAASLQALLRIDPGSPLIPKTVWWLVTNRQGDHWKSTKDTALAIAALSEYLVRTKELQPGYTAHVYVNGALAQSIEVTPQNALSLDGRITLDPKVLKTGGNTVRIRKDGGGALYYALTASYDSTEEPIKGASTMLSVSRAIYAVEDTIDEDGGPETKRTPISGPVPSGTLLEVELTISSENDIDYVMFEDPKPAGCEPVALTSGYDYSGSLYPYRELRDEKVSFFVNHLKQGENTLVYRLRAEIPGDFHVLPDVGKGMYLTDARCLGDETRLSVR